ncbi:MAG: ATPase [Erysipelotrichaceae bacterium]|nr:ATPase [Erysipelotrichaceae bacterium]
MTAKIFRSVFASCILVAAMTVGLVVLALNNYFVTIEEERIASEADLAAAGVNAAGEGYFDDLKIEGYRLTWINAHGTVLYDSQADASTMENHGDRQEVKEALLSGTGKSDRNSYTLAEETMYYAERCSDGTVVRLAVSRNSVFLLVLRLATPLLWICIAAVAVAYWAGRRASHKISEPLNHIDLENPLQNQNVEEIRPLLKRIDEQNQQINDQIEKLHQKQKEFITATSSMREGLILINTKYQILSQNPAAQRLFQLDAAAEYPWDDCNEQLHQCIEAALAGQQNTAIITEGEKIIRIDVSPITSHGILIGASILAYDISEEYTAEMQRKEFTANVSHELKTPLQSIMGSAELLQNHMVKEEDIPSFLNRINTESKRLLALIDDIIRLSQLDENQKMEKDELDLKDTVNEVFDSLEKNAFKHHVTLHLKTEKASVYGNSRLLYEIVYNLMDNAIRYNKDPGSVTVETYQDDHSSYLKVTDTGIGIPQEAQERIFERFYRVDKSHSRATGGTGLGLSIVKHAVQISHAAIQVASAPGEGSTFTVVFPNEPQR